MPRRSILSAAERQSLLALPETEAELIQHYTLSEPDLSLIRQRRGEANRLGFAVQLCYLRFPGTILGVSGQPHLPLLNLIAQQLNLSRESWGDYGQRQQTRREHQAELQAWLGISMFTTSHYRLLVHYLAELAQQTDRSIVLAEALVEFLRKQRIVVPALDVIERVCSEAQTRGTRQVYKALTKPLAEHHRRGLDGLLLARERTKGSGLIWLRQPPGPPRSKHLLLHLERLKTLQGLELPDDLEHAVHQNRLLKLAREGGQMTAQHLRDLEPARRYATLVAVILETRATLTDEIIDLHDRLMGSLFSKAKRKHADRFQHSGKAINEKVRLLSRIGRALLDAKLVGGDPFAAIEAIITWDALKESITEAESLAQSESFDFLSLVGDGFNQLRRYTPMLLESLNLRATHATQELLEAIEVLKAMNTRQGRKVPDGVPTSFVRRRWKNLVFKADGLDRRFYELCVLSELKNSLRSGDIWVKGSRQFKDFEDYLLPPTRFEVQRDQRELGLSVETDCERFLTERLTMLQEQLEKVEQLASAKELPNAAINSSGQLKISPLESAVPEEAKALMKQAYSLLPRLKITELLLEVNGWTSFCRHFKHLKTDAMVED